MPQQRGSSDRWLSHVLRLLETMINVRATGVKESCLTAPVQMLSVGIDLHQRVVAPGVIRLRWM